VKCLSQEKYRNEVFRTSSNVREHVTLLPPVLVMLDEDGKIEAIHHLTPLFVFPRQYVNTKTAMSRLDPANRKSSLNLLQEASRGYAKFAASPPGLPAPSAFPRFVGASESGNVNGQMILNFFRRGIFPEVREAGVSMEDLLLTLWDLHASHAGAELLQYFKQENNISAFFPGHATNWLQFHDAKDGPLQKLKSTCRKDFATWNVHLRRRNQTLCTEDFPFVTQHAIVEMRKAAITERALKNIGLEPFDPDAVLRRMPGAKTFAEYEQQFLEEEKKEEKKKLAKEKGEGKGQGDKEGGEWKYDRE
jgi:hypothetical protein